MQIFLRAAARALVPSSASFALVLSAAGCYERTLAPSTPCTRADIDLRVAAMAIDSVDLLLLVDNSNSMAGEQALLTAELPRMVRILASGDQDEDGEPDITPLRSLHVGIVTSDMGAGPALPPGETVPSCRPGLGDDGILRGTATSCSGSPLPFFEFGAGDDPSGFATAVGCVAVVGTGGCGFEQQLEATLKAVSPASATAGYVASGYEPPIFAGGTFGHGDGANAGFVRADSALALMIVTDEEDCSVPDYTLFYDVDPRFSGVGLNLRCFSFPGELHPLDRYVDGFLQLRDNPGLLVYASIAGVPTDLTGDDVDEYDAILADPRMQEVVDGTGTRLVPSCTTADGDGAFPPRRMVGVARGLALGGAHTTVQSICADDFRPAVDRVLELIGNAIEGACLPRPLNRAADGTVGCEVREVLAAAGSSAPITRCEDLGPFAERIGVETGSEGDVHEICRIAQLTEAEVGTGAIGWHYDTSDAVVARCGGSAPPGQRISFVGHAPPRGSEVRLECAQEVLAGGADTIAQLGTFCEPGPESPGVATAENACPGARVPSRADLPGDYDHLSCDVLTRSCQVRCRTDADCGLAGLAASVCDLRPMSEVTGGSVPDGVDPEAPYAVCVNPTCGS